MRWGWVIVGGVVGAGFIVGLLAWRKAQQWQERAQQTRLALQARGTALELALTSSGAKLSDELAAEGRHLAESAARAEAERVIGIEYGITPTRLAAISRLAQRLGV